MYGPIVIDDLINRGPRIIAACSASCCTRSLGVQMMSVAKSRELLLLKTRRWEKTFLLGSLLFYLLLMLLLLRVQRVAARTAQLATVCVAARAAAATRAAC